MIRSKSLIPFFLATWLLALSACDSGEPEQQPQLRPASARPYEVVSVLGLSANYAAGAREEIEGLTRKLSLARHELLCFTAFLGVGPIHYRS